MPHRLRTWLLLLQEPVGQPQRGNGRRISRAGQIALSLTLCLIGLSAYASAWILSQRLGRSWQICLTLEPSGILWQNQQQTHQLIDALSAASTGQKLRLRQQSSWTLHQMDGLCRMSIWYGSQEAGLTTVATAAAATLLTVLAMGLPRGLANNSRFLQTILLTATLQLVLAVSFLQLGQQTINSGKNLTAYRDHRQLLEWLQTSLANQQMPPSAPPGQALTTTAPAREVGGPLTNPAAVAALIQSIDQRLRSMPTVAIKLDGELATEMFGRITSEDKPDTPGQATTPLTTPARPAVSGPAN